MSENQWLGKMYGLSRFGEGVQSGTPEWRRLQDQREAEVRYWRDMWESQGWKQDSSRPAISRFISRLRVVFTGRSE